MEAILKSLGTEIYDFNDHKGYLIQWSLISPLCKKWSRNRDPDVQRVEEMINHHNKGGYIPRMIHLAELKEDGLVCYDGNHRREVFDKCNDEIIMCVVDVMFDASENKVYKAFNNINKSVQLPAIYIDEPKDTKLYNNVKEDILKLVKDYEAKFKPLLSTSPRCHVPNFNRDNFTDNVYNIYKSFGGFVSIVKIGELLETLNTEYSQGRICRPHCMYKQTVLDKCKKHNMWLFVERNIPFEHVERVMNNNY